MAGRYATIAIVASEAAHSNGCIHRMPGRTSSRLGTSAASTAVLTPRTPSDASTDQSTSCCITPPTSACNILSTTSYVSSVPVKTYRVPHDALKHLVKLSTTTTTTVLRPFFRDHPGEPVPEENCWTLWCKGRLTEADAPNIRLGATPSGLTSAHLHRPPIFYRPDTLPATQRTASKHRRQLAHSD